MATGYATPVRTNAVEAGIATPASSVQRSEPSTPFSPFTTQDPFDAEVERQRVEGEAKRFTDAKSTLVSAIETSSGLLDELKKFSNGAWTIHYPASSPIASSVADSEGVPPPSAPNGAPLSTEIRRSASDSTDTASSSNERPRPPRSFTTTSTSGYVSQSDGLTVLSVETFAGGKGRMLASAASGLAASLGRETLANLLLSHVGSVKNHLGDLRERLLDGSSRILITGDLNAGKSTFVNALLGREVAPVDQQPCTEIMCEISNASGNDGVEEIHAVKRGSAYDRNDPNTFVRMPLEKLSEVVTITADDDDDSEAEAQSPFDMLKVYVEGRERAQETDAVSLLRNGDISVSFIDAPGLNRDTVSTTALFAKQSAIDVVIFVVSAENQFTLSAQEFLWAASQEKAYVFVVVNKWDAISNKTRAERRVRDQIKKLSPRTWEGRKELIHFVDSQSASRSPAEAELGDAFNHLERSLSSFVLSKRFISKLQPAQTYLGNLLHDLSVIADVNLSAAGQQELEASVRLQQIMPECKRLTSAKVELEQGIDSVEEQTVDAVKFVSQTSLRGALDSIAQGKASEPVRYPGLAGIWQYAVDVQRAFAETIEVEVRAAEDHARQRTIVGVKQIREDLGKQALPGDQSHTERVFNPEVMFARRRKSAGIGAAAATSLGLGLTQASPDEIRFMDLFDIERFAELAHRLVKPAGDETSLSLVGGVGVGSLALLSTGAASGKAFVDSIVRICEVLGSKGARRWAGTVVAVMTIGLGVYLVVDLPRAVPRNVGRRMQRQLDASSAASGSNSWADAQSQRISKETRKVLRLAGWDLRERFRAALEKAQAEQESAQDALKGAKEAMAWLEEFSGRIEAVGSGVELVNTSVEWQ